MPLPPLRQDTHRKSNTVQLSKEASMNTGLGMGLQLSTAEDVCQIVSG